MVCAINNSERIAALGVLLDEVSQRLDILLSSGRITTDFMVADRSSGTARYVPAYILDGIKGASTVERVEDLSPRHDKLVARLIAHVQRHVPTADVDLLYALKSEVSIYQNLHADHVNEVRALYLDRMLHIGSVILTEIALYGLVDDIGSLQQRIHRCRKEVAPGIQYGPAWAVTQKAVQLLRSRGLDREARSVELFEAIYIEDRAAA